MESSKQSFYIALILYKSHSDVSDYKPLDQECFTLIKASSLEKAQEKALAHAKKEEGSYQNVYEETITWTLKQVVDVKAVLYDEFEDATDLYARHFQNYEAYCSFEPLLSSEDLQV